MAIVVLRNMVIGIFLPSSRTYLQPTADFQQQCNLESCKYGTLIPKHPAILQHVLAFGTAAPFKTYGRESFPLPRNEGLCPLLLSLSGHFRDSGLDLQSLPVQLEKERADFQDEKHQDGQEHAEAALGVDMATTPIPTRARA